MRREGFAAVAGLSLLADACADDREPDRVPPYLEIVANGEVLSITDEGTANPFPGALPVRVRAKSDTEAGHPVSYLITIGEQVDSSYAGAIGMFSCDVNLASAETNRLGNGSDEVDAGLPEGRTGRIIIDDDRYQIELIVRGNGETMSPTEVIALLEKELPPVVETLRDLEERCSREQEP